MNETGTNQDATVNAGTTEEVNKTFTQAELDKIVGERLSRERAKYEGFDELKAKAAKFDEMEEANKTELQKMSEKAQALQTELDSLKKAATIRDLRDKVAKETGVPASLLTGDTEEACKAQAEAIKEFANPSSYPTVKDGGEIHNLTKRTSKEAFADFVSEVL